MMPNMSANDFLVMINNIDTYGHAELVQNKIKLMDELLTKLIQPSFGDALGVLVPANEIELYCKAVDHVLHKPEYKNVLLGENGSFSFNYNGLNVDNVKTFAAAVTKKRAKLLLASAPLFVDKTNIDKVKSNLIQAIEKAKSEQEIAKSKVNGSDEMKAALGIYEKATNNKTKLEGESQLTQSKLDEAKKNKEDFEKESNVILMKNKLDNAKQSHDLIVNAKGQAIKDLADLPDIIKALETEKANLQDEIAKLSENIEIIKKENENKIILEQTRLNERLDNQNIKMTKLESNINDIEDKLKVPLSNDNYTKPKESELKTFEATRLILNKEIDEIKSNLVKLNEKTAANNIRISELEKNISDCKILVNKVADQSKINQEKISLAKVLMANFESNESKSLAGIKKLGEEIEKFDPQLKQSDSEISLVENAHTAAIKKLHQASNDIEAALQKIEKAKGNVPELMAKHNDLTECLNKVTAIEKAKVDFEAKRDALAIVINGQSVTDTVLNEKIKEYEQSLGVVNNLIKSYNPLAGEENKITPPYPAPTRELSTARINANWTTQVGVGPDGIGHGICTDKNRIDELWQLASTSNALTVSEANTTKPSIGRANLLPTEITYSIKEYSNGADGKPSKLLVTQEQKNNKVSNCSSGKLTDEQLQETVLEMAKMYAINYKGGGIEIRGDQPKQANMMHAALLRLLPGEPITNYVLGADSPHLNNKFLNNRFVNKHFPNGDNIFKAAKNEVNCARGIIENKVKEIAKVDAKYASDKEPGFFGCNRKTKDDLERLKTEYDSKIDTINLKDHEGVMECKPSGTKNG